MSLDLDAIKKRAARATPGPWKCDTARSRAHDDAPDFVVAEALDWGPVAILTGPEKRTVPDMVFIADAREDIPALIAEVEQLSAQEIPADEHRCTATATGCAGTRCQNYRSDGYDECFICRERGRMYAEVETLRAEVVRLREKVQRFHGREEI